jgi:hypothetical protein
MTGMVVKGRTRMTTGIAFNADFYRNSYEDLRHLSDEEAHQHFLAFGQAEGRLGAKQAYREFFLPMIPRDRPVLEIGPFDCPVVRGDHVRYADVLSQEGLRRRAAELGRNPEGCPAIHYVLESFDLNAIPDRFGAVVSSHCIEHQIDLIGHLQTIETLLEPGGSYFLLVPDKRYCFDHFLPVSSIAEVFAAHVERRKQHSLACVIEHWALTCHNDAARHWAGDHGTPPLRLNEIGRAVEAFTSTPSRYIDVHAWQFTPDVFLAITSVIADLGYTKLRPVQVFNTPRDNQEFCAVLNRDA